MRVYSNSNNGHLYRVWDYQLLDFRYDCLWVDDVTNQLGVGYEGVVEQRRRVLILPFMRRIGVDIPEEDARKNRTLMLKKETTYGTAVPYVNRTIKVRML